jgi:hypothetical protein
MLSTQHGLGDTQHSTQRLDVHARGGFEQVEDRGPAARGVADAGPRLPYDPINH